VKVNGKSIRIMAGPQWKPCEIDEGMAGAMGQVSGSGIGIEDGACDSI
jgi:hypothetical protein